MLSRDSLGRNGCLKLFTMPADFFRALAFGAAAAAAEGGGGGGGVAAPRRGRAVQVVPMKPTLNAPGTKRLN
jgi:hypothetical protein